MTPKPKTLGQMAEEWRADAGLTQNTDGAIAYETGFLAGAQAALSLPEVVGMRETLDRILPTATWFHIGPYGATPEIEDYHRACAALAAFDALKENV